MGSEKRTVYIRQLMQYYVDGNITSDTLERIIKPMGRYEFIGNIAEESIRKKYVGKVVSDLFPKGNQNPIKYVWGAAHK